MATVLIRTGLALGEIEQHLADTQSFGTPIETYLTQYLLILLCADVQEGVNAIVTSAAARTCDQVRAEFVKQACNRLFRSVAKEEIAKLAGMFSADVRDKLNRALDERAVTIYSNAANARHHVAHKAGAAVTFREVREAVAAATMILSSLEAALA